MGLATPERRAEQVEDMESGDDCRRCDGGDVAYRASDRHRTYYRCEACDARFVSHIYD